MFSQACVKNPVHRWEACMVVEGEMFGGHAWQGEHAWQGLCAWRGGVCDRGMHGMGGGHVWQGACMAGGMCGKGSVKTLVLKSVV